MLFLHVSVFVFQCNQGLKLVDFSTTVNQYIICLLKCQQVFSKFLDILRFFLRYIKIYPSTEAEGYGSKLFFIEYRNARGKADHHYDGTDGECREVILRFRRAVDKGISVREHGRQIFLYFRDHPDYGGTEGNAARCDENACVCACDGGEEYDEGDDPQAEDPPANDGECKVLCDRVIPEIRVIHIGDTEADPIADRPENGQNGCLRNDDFIALEPLREGKNERAGRIFLRENTALKQYEGDQRHGGIFEKLHPRIHRSDGDVRDSHAAFGKRVCHHFQ